MTVSIIYIYIYIYYVVDSLTRTIIYVFLTVSATNLPGFENSVRGCCGTGYVETGVLCSLDNSLTCDNADKYVFFDAVHPSERAYQMLAKAILNTAPHTLK
jgi:phospholipase/lecithinase/hemolysin